MPMIMSAGKTPKFGLLCGKPMLMIAALADRAALGAASSTIPSHNSAQPITQFALWAVYV